MHRLFIVPLLIFLGLLASCSTPAPKAKQSVSVSSAQSQKQYQDAQKLFDLGQDDAAANKLKQILKQDHQSDIVDDSLILLGRIEFRKKNFSEAYAYFEKVFTSTLLSPRENEARIFAVQCLLAQNKNSEADRLIRNSLGQPSLAPKEKAYLLEAQVPILLASDAQLEAFEALAYLAQNHPNANSRDRYKEIAKDFIDSRLKTSDLKTLSEEDDIGEFRTEAMFQYAMDLVEENQLDTAKSYFSRVMSLAPGSYLAQQSASMVKQLEARSYVELKSIGVVLPMSGPYSSIGQQALKGIQLALGISGTTNKYNLRLHIIDTKDSPEEASRAVESLILKDHVLAIIGGLTSKTATAEATKAQELGAPFIALSNKSGLTKLGPFIFRCTVTPKLQVSTLVGLAMEKFNAKNFAILYPNDGFGVEYSNLFWDEVIRRGGRVTTAQTYVPGETDFKTSVKKMAGTYYIEDRKSEYEDVLRAWKVKNKNSRKSPPEGLLPPIIDFQAIFIPDDPKAFGQIAPMLAVNDVTGVRLMGTNLWNSPDFVNRSQNFGESSLFVDAFVADSPLFLNSPFYKEFRQQFQERPGTFAVQGFDAGRLVLQAVNNKPKNRIDFLRLLTNKDPVAGATSPLMMGEDREIVKTLIPLTVKKGIITPVE